MEPRPYQAEAFDAARKANVVMVGATGVGKTLVSLMLIRDYYFEDASRQDSETHKWCIFLCPTQELVFQQARSAQIFTGVRCGPYVGKDLDYWGLDKWKEEMDNKDVLVMTPNALLNLLHRGTEYLSLRDVGVLVFDECHKARKKHPYARIMAFYLDLVKSGEPVPKVFGMTASPTVECVQVLQSKAYVCEDDLIEEFQANAQWELLFYKPFAPSQTVVDELESLMRMLFSESMCGFGDSKEKFVDIVVAPVLFTYQHLGLWCAMRQIIMFCEGFLRSRVAQDLPDRSRVARTRKVVLQLIQQLLDSPLGLAVSGIERPPQPPPTNAPPDSSSKPVAAATGKDGSRGDDGIGAGSNPKSPGRNESQGGEGEGSGGGRGGGGASNGGGSGGPDGDSVSGDGGGGSLKSGVGEAGKGKGSRGSSDFAAAVAAAAAATEAAAAAAAAAVAAASKADEAGQGGGAKTVSGGSGKDPMDEDAGDGDKQSEGGEDNTKGDGGQQDVGASKNDAQQDGVGASEAGENVPRSPEAMEWGLTPSRVTTLIKTLLRVSDEWGEEAKHFRCMVFVERRATARLLSEYLSHTLKGRFSCGFVVGRAKARGSTVHGGEGDESRAARLQQAPGKKEWRPLPDDIARDSEEDDDRNSDDEDDEEEKGRLGGGGVGGRRVGEEGGSRGGAVSGLHSGEARKSDTGSVTSNVIGALDDQANTEKYRAEELELSSEDEEAEETALSFGRGGLIGHQRRVRDAAAAAAAATTAADAATAAAAAAAKNPRDSAAAAAAAAAATAAATAAAIAKTKAAEAAPPQGRRSPGQENDGEEKEALGVPALTGVGAADACSRSKNAQTIDLFRVGEVQVLVTTDACSEGIDVPECNLVVSMDKIHTSRSLIHTRGRARSKGGKFVIMLESGEDVERDRVAVMLMEAEDIKRYQLSHEKASKRVPLRHSHPNMVHRIESTGAVVDMDMSTPLMKAALGSLGCDFQPLLIAEEITGPAMVYREKSYKCRLELPSFLGMPTIDTSSLINEHFWTKGQARAAVSFLAVVKMLGKKYIDHRLNPRRVKDRLVVETRRGYDPVLVEGREARIKAKMPVPRPVAMGILPTPAVDFDAALTAAWKAANKSRSSSNSGSGVDASAAGSTNASGGQARGESAGALPAGSAAGSSTAAAAGAAGAGDPSGGGERSGGGDSGLALGPSPPSNGNASGVGRGSTSKAEEFGEQRKEDRDGPSGEATSSAPAIDPAAAGAGYAVWEGARTRGCYENVPGPKRRMRIYCFRSPPGEVEGWVPKTKKVWRKKKPEDDGVVDKKEDGSGEGMQLEEEAEKDGEAGKDGEEGGEGEKVEEEVEEHEADMQSFHPKLKVDLGRGPGKGLGPRLFVGLASAAPLPLTATQASKLGILDSFDVDLNPAQMAAMVQWHRETVGMAALYEIPHQMTQTPQNDPAKSPFLNTGSVGDKGVLAVPVDYGDDGDGGDGVLKIDWPAIEAANAGVHLPDETEEYYTRRILFSRVSHKTCRFYFILEKTKTTLGEYLQRCLESDQGPYAGLPCETITPHDAGRMGRVEGVLAVGHGIRKPDYEAADKSQRLLLGVPAPALRHSFAQHLIRGERVMDPDAGVRSRVKVKRSKLEPSEDEDNPDDGATVGPAVAGGGSDEKAPVERSNSDGDGAVVEEGEDKDVAADPMVVDSPQASKRPASPEKAGQAAGAVTDVVTAGAAVTLEAQRMEELEEDDDGQPRGWAGVSTLKLNTHRVGPGQPVLLVEQYTQSVCCTRRVFISVLHLVPRMFDLERQLLCFVLHESLFLPALRTSLYHRTSAIDTRNGNHSSGTQSNNKTKLLLSSAADAAVTAGGDSPAITSPKEGATAPADGSGGKTAMGDGTTVATVASAPSEASQLVLLGTAAGGTATSAQAEATTETPAPTAVECTPASTSPVNDARTGADKANAGKEGARELEKAAAAAGADGTAVALETNPSTTPVSWPPHGAWCTPGEGAGTGAGPGGTGCGGGTSSSKAPPFPPLAANGLAGFGVTEIGGGAGKGVVGEAANVSGEAIAKAAATGVVQWEWGGEGAVTDTMALLDCSLRRPVNERLETLGDAWLNYYAGLVVFQDKPVLLEEGMMTLLRKNVVSNARLLKCADGRGLREFMYPPRSILGRPFDMWSPSLLPLPPPVKASRKTIADVVEALLGAALVAGGNRSAAFLMAWLGLPTLESSNDPEKAKEAAAASAAAAAAAAASSASTAAVGAPADAGGAGSTPKDAEEANTPAGDPPEGEKEGVSGSGAVGEAGLETSPTAEAGAEGTSPTSGAAAAALAAAPTCGRVGELSAAAAASAAGSAAALLEKEAGSGPKRIRARGGGWLLARGGAGSSGSGDSSTELSVEARPDPMDEEEVSGGGGDGGGEFEAASSPKRKGSSSEGDDLMPSLKRVRTPEEEPGDAASDAMDLADGTAAGVAAKGDGAREEPEEEETEDTKEDATEDDDDEGPDSGDEGGGAVTDAAAAAGAARAAKRAAALAGAGEVPSGTGVDPGAASNAVGEGDGGGGNSGGDVVSGGDGDAAGLRTRKKPLRKRAQLRDHIPEVDERTRPWLWNPPDYMWGDPGRFGGGYGVGDAGLGGRGVGGRRADSSGLSRRDGKDVPGVHARAGGESFAFSSASGRCGGGSGDYASRSLTAATAMMHNSGSGGGGGGGGGVSADPSPPEAASGTPAASERQGGATPVHALASAGVEPAQAANPAAMEVDADVNDAQAKGINAHGSGAVVGPSCSGHKAQGGANGSGKATGDDTGAAKEGIGRDRDGAGTNGPGGEADAKQGEESGAGSSAGAGAVAAAAPNEARKTTEKTAAPKWVGLCLEGMKGSARWPIRKEPLMSAEYLAEAGVLPKVYVKTRPSARLMGNIRRLEKRLGYTFRYPWLCMQAITHPSWTMFDRNWNSSVKPTAIAGGIDRLMEKTLDGGSVEGISSHDIPPGTVPAQDYQRLEFLGDAVLGWMVTAHLYFASSDFTPAELTRIKSSCVCNASLWVIAIRLDVHHVLRASPKILGNIHAFIQNNEIHSGCTPPKHPADVLEALIAAVYLDSSCCMDTVSQVFWPLIAQYLQDYPPPAADEMDGGGGSTTRGSAVGDMAVRAPASVAPAPAAAPASTPAPASAAAEAPTEESATAGGVEATSTTSVGDVSAALQDKASATDLPAPQAAAAADDISAGGTAARASDSDVGMGEGANGQVGGADLSVAGVSDAGIGSGASRDGRGGADVGVCPSPDGVCDGFVCEACEAAEANDDGGGALGAGLGVAPMAVEGADAGGENKR